MPKVASAVLSRFVVVVLALVFVTGSAQAEEVQARMFATNNTAIITDPDDPRLEADLVEFERQVRGIVQDNGARAGRSELLDGVFWSTELQRATYERSRAFDVHETDALELHHVADLVRKEFDQESVLTFEYLPQQSPRTDAVEIVVPGVESADVRRALASDPQARERLGGGSVTMDGTLVLVAEVADLELARRFVGEVGGDWGAAEVRYGDREFVG